jgi:hypothetical protein
MNTLELRNIVMAQVSQIEDKSFLAALKTILDTKVEPKIILTGAQRKELEASALEAKKGLFKPHSVLDKEVRQWLEEK